MKTGKQGKLKPKSGLSSSSDVQWKSFYWARYRAILFSLKIKNKESLDVKSCQKFGQGLHFVVSQMLERNFP